jgi:uncharacterized protein (DUF486 family)
VVKKGWWLVVQIIAEYPRTIIITNNYQQNKPPTPMRGFLTIALLIASNSFMTLAWYGHLNFKNWGWFPKAGSVAVIFISWGMAFFEYCFQVPANRLGFNENGGPFNMVQLKVIQEVITLVVFSVFLAVVSKKETMQWNHLVAFGLLVGAVYFVFKK